MIDRSKFKATSTATLKKIVEDEDKKLGSGSKDILKFTPGKNKLRIAPAFPGEDSFYVMRCNHWVSLEHEGDIVRRTVMNARVHGGYSSDIMEEYINFVKRRLKPSDKEDGVKLAALTDKDTSIMPQTFWSMYVWKIEDDTKKLGIIDFKKTVRDALNTLSIIEDEDEAIQLDPFTDPDDGKCIMVTYDNKAKKAADYYKVQLLTKQPYTLTNEDLEELDSKKSLTELFVGTYSIAEFERALDAIQYFDTQHEIFLIDDNEFQDTIDKLKQDITGKTSAPSANVKAVKPTKVQTSKKKVEEDDEEEEEESAPKSQKAINADEFDEMTRQQLREYIAENEFPIKVIKGSEDDTVRNDIRKYLKTVKASESPFKEDAIEEEEESEEEEATEEDETPKPAMSKMEEIKARLKSGTKK